MILVDELIGEETTVTLDEPREDGGTRILAEVKSGSPKTEKATKQDLRTDPQELENAYIFDPIVFNSINKICQTIMATDYEIVANDEESLKGIKDFMSNISKVGEPMTEEEFMYSCFQNECVFGWQWVELVFNNKMDDILDLVVPDPKSMDYAKDSSGKILTDDVGRPIGYTQKLPWDTPVSGRGDKYPNDVSLDSNMIFLKPERIALMKLYTIGDGYYPIGLVEPGYKSTLRKMNIEEAQSNSIYARGTYPIIDKVGDIDHQPTPDMIRNATSKLKKLAHNRYFAFPYWHDINALEVKQSEVVDQTLNHLRENQSASMGMPLALATGAGEKTNRATLGNQQMVWEFTLNDIVKRVVSNIRKFIFAPVCEIKGYKEVPKIKWGNVSAEEPNDKAKRIYMYARYGLLTREEVVNFIKKSEGL